MLSGLLFYSCTCSVNDAKQSYSGTDDFPLVLQQETKRPLTDIALGQFAEVPSSLGFEDRHLVARPLAQVSAEDFYLGPLEQPVWVRLLLERIEESIMEAELAKPILADSFPAGLVASVNAVLASIDNPQELRFSRAPEETTPFITLDFVLLTKELRIPGQCIIDTTSGKLLHMLVAQSENWLPREQKGDFNPLDSARKPIP